MSACRRAAASECAGLIVMLASSNNPAAGFLGLLVLERLRKIVGGSSEVRLFTDEELRPFLEAASKLNPPDLDRSTELLARGIVQ